MMRGGGPDVAVLLIGRCGMDVEMAPLSQVHYVLRRSLMVFQLVESERQQFLLACTSSASAVTKWTLSVDPSLLIGDRYAHKSKSTMASALFGYYPAVFPQINRIALPHLPISPLFFRFLLSTSTSDLINTCTTLGNEILLDSPASRATTAPSRGCRHRSCS